MAILYPPPDRPSEHVAFVSGEDSGNGAVFIEVVDGTRLNPEPWKEFSLLFGSARVNEVELLPGPHTLEVSWLMGRGGRSISNAVLSLDAEAGHRYKIWADAMPPGSAWKRTTLFLVGGQSGWTAWITDEKSSAIVAGAPPPQ